jgi:hypothetical protein
MRAPVRPQSSRIARCTKMRYLIVAKGGIGGRPSKPHQLRASPSPASGPESLHTYAATKALRWSARRRNRSPRQAPGCALEYVVTLSVLRMCSRCKSSSVMSETWSTLMSGPVCAEQNAQGGKNNGVLNDISQLTNVPGQSCFTSASCASLGINLSLVRRMTGWLRSFTIAASDC